MSATAQRSDGWTLGELTHGLLDVPPLDPSAARTVIAGLCEDSRAARPGDLFFARPGASADGVRFVPDAVRAGAVAVVYAAGAEVSAGVPGLAVADVPQAMGRIAHRFHGEPSRHLRLVGVTGTNGKTSVTHLVAGATRAAFDGERRCAQIGTLGHGFGNALRGGELTTPGTLTLHAALAELRAAGATDVAMEVSSHALAQNRVAGLRFTGAVFTNLTHDHLDYHAGPDDYARAKRTLLERPEIAWAVVNWDDPAAGAMAGAVRPGARLVACSLAGAEHQAGPPPRRCERLHGRVTAASAAGLELALEGDFGRASLASPLVGHFNASNLLLALGVLLAGGADLAAACGALSVCTAPPGRLQRVQPDAAGPLVVVDYSHTPDSLDKALATLGEIAPARLWCVFGCGGDRDRAKRPRMGAIAARRADEIVVTSDNPRGEDPGRIIDEILTGIPDSCPRHVEVDRRKAIALAISGAGEDDIVLVAGKGHEDYQEIAGVRLPFDDALVAAALLEGLRR